MEKNRNLESTIFETGSKLLKESQSHNSLFLQKNWWYQKMLSWTMSNQKLKTNLFRFIDVLPSLSNDEQFLSHFKEYFKDQDLIRFGASLGKLAPSLMVKNINKQISQVAKMFITGSHIEPALEIISKNWNQNLAFSLDILGEATLSEEEAEIYFKKYFELMEKLKTERTKWPFKEILQKDVWGDLPSVNVSIKASALFSQIYTEAWSLSKEALKNKLRPLFQKAVQDFIFINLDMENYHLKDLFLEIFKELLMEEDFKNYPHFGIVLQTYLKDSLQDLQALSQFSDKRGQAITVRLVKGAYWDSEVLLSMQKNWPIPVYTNKNETDANFEKCLKWLFEKAPQIKIAIGSHNVRSISYGLALKEMYPNKPLEFQFLYGMGENLAKSLQNRGHLVRLYCTIGDLIPGMSYLVRRLLENSANQSFILNSLLKNKSAEELLASPIVVNKDEKNFEKENSKGESDSGKLFSKTKKASKTSLVEDSFSNHPLLDFSKENNREKFHSSLEKWTKKFPIEIPVIIEGKNLKSSQTLQRENPSQPEQILSCSFLAEKQHTEKAIQSTSDFFKKWRFSPPKERISSLRKLAHIIKDKEFELSGLQVFEVGKTWAEAQADVAEAIDFCNYYAWSYEKLIQEKPTEKLAGEQSFSRFEPVGPTAVIAPWNFPLAILTGMVTAPLVCGNTVLIKPAEQSSLTAYYLAQMLLESGFPKESFAFLPGRGEETGAYLVEHPQVPIISFTGSFEVGTQIIKASRHITNKQKEIKRCIVEMGGKNAIVIDSSADLDEALIGVIASAFGFQGQKCSACSRLIILEDVYESFIKRLLPAVKSLTIGNPKNPVNRLGPLIDKNSWQKIKDFIAREKSQKLFEGKFEGEGWFCPPMVYLAEDGSSELMQEELFAPVLAVFKVKDLDQAIEEINNVRFGLTTAFYSRQPSHIEKFKNLVEVGNLYINRNCTGALVKRHPFGGRKMSGLGSKAGGPEYLKHFMHTKITTENTMRRGFAPELFEEDF